MTETGSRHLKEAAKLVKATPENLAEKITHLQAENKALTGRSGELEEQDGSETQ